MESGVYEDFLDKAFHLLRDYPLCDRCLGRMFARLGMGFSNKERGDAIKKMVVMRLHQMIRQGDEKAKIIFKMMAPHIGLQADELYLSIFGEKPTREQCYICSDRLDAEIESATDKAIRLLDEWGVERFLVGARASFDVIRREEEVKTRYRLVYSESIKNEVKREVGKRIVRRGFVVDFDDPEATVLVELWGPRVSIQVNPVFFKAVYWKVGRNISQSYWPTRNGVKYPFSVEQATWELRDAMSAERTVIHAAGREDADARMLGTGRPLIIEVKKPKNRRVSNREAEELLNRGGGSLVLFKVLGRASRKHVRLYKEEMAGFKKLYKALVVSSQPVDKDGLASLESFFTGRVISQRTPLRVSHRRADLTRVKRVYEVKNVPLTSHLFYSFILAEGGLYVKELISGDGGRTSPSFAEVLGKEMECVDLDVLGVDFNDVGNG